RSRSEPAWHRERAEEARPAYATHSTDRADQANRDGDRRPDLRRSDWLADACGPRLAQFHKYSVCGRTVQGRHPPPARPRIGSGGRHESSGWFERIASLSPALSCPYILIGLGRPACGKRATLRNYFARVCRLASEPLACAKRMSALGQKRPKSVKQCAHVCPLCPRKRT